MKKTDSKTPSHCKNLWLSNIIFLSEKLGLDLNLCKNFGKYKFKKMLKKQLKIHFPKIWEKIKDDYQLKQGKLDTYFSFKTSFDYENYLDLKNNKKIFINQIQTQ